MAAGLQYGNGLSPRKEIPLDWWRQATELASESVVFPERAQDADFYRLGEGQLVLDSADSALCNRFQQIYGECRIPAPAAQGEPEVSCVVRPLRHPDLCLISIHPTPKPHPVEFALAMFQGRGYHEVPEGKEGWRMIASAERPEEPLLAFRGSQVIADRRQSWQPFIANYAVNCLLQMQRQLMFFHAASIGIGDAGVLLAGPKGSAKSTLSLTLASRGHAFLGDEVAAVRSDTGELVPFRRSASLRPGPRPRELDRLLHERGAEAEVYPDGTTRLRVLVGEYFPRAAARFVSLRHAFFLRGFAPAPRAERFVPRPQDVRLLAPLGCTLWERSPARCLMHVLSLLSKTRCYYLNAGSPEETAAVIEEILGE